MNKAWLFHGAREARTADSAVGGNPRIELAAANEDLTAHPVAGERFRRDAIQMAA